AGRTNGLLARSAVRALAQRTRPADGGRARRLSISAAGHGSVRLVLVVVARGRVSRQERRRVPAGDVAAGVVGVALGLAVVRALHGHLRVGHLHAALLGRHGLIAALVVRVAAESGIGHLLLLLVSSGAVLGLGALA